MLKFPSSSVLMSALFRRKLCLNGFNKNKIITRRYLHPSLGRNCQGSIDSSSSILVPGSSNLLSIFSFVFDNTDEPSCKITRLFVLISSS